MLMSSLAIALCPDLRWGGANSTGGLELVLDLGWLEDIDVVADVLT
jgi:hypothetical protein